MRQAACAAGAGDTLEVVASVYKDLRGRRGGGMPPVMPGGANRPGGTPHVHTVLVAASRRLPLHPPRSPCMPGSGVPNDLILPRLGTPSPQPSRRGPPRIKYYNNCIFHNVQRNFIAQTGDPTGTGKGGTSIYGCVCRPRGTGMGRVGDTGGEGLPQALGWGGGKCSQSKARCCLPPQGSGAASPGWP